MSSFCPAFFGPGQGDDGMVHSLNLHCDSLMSSRKMIRDLTLFLSLFLSTVPAFAEKESGSVHDSLASIIEEIGEPESKKDAKCYATATRLENFIFGTPVSPEARFEKTALQKKIVMFIWQKASTAASKDNKSTITSDHVVPFLQEVLKASGQ